MHPIVTDKKELSIVCSSIGDAAAMKQIVRELLNAAEWHAMFAPVGCIGLAANQIGHKKRIIAILFNGHWLAMVNPILIRKWGGKQNREERCLSRPGVTVKKNRYRRITVEFFDPATRKTVTRKYSGTNARAVQHEIDHLNGILI